MADIPIPGDVSSGGQATQIVNRQIAEAVTAGRAVYEDADTDDKCRPVDPANRSTSKALGLALTSGSNPDDWIVVALTGDVATGATTMDPGKRHLRFQGAFVSREPSWGLTTLTSTKAWSSGAIHRT